MLTTAVANHHNYYNISATLMLKEKPADCQWTICTTVLYWGVSFDDLNIVVN